MPLGSKSHRGNEETKIMEQVSGGVLTNRDGLSDLGLDMVMVVITKLVWKLTMRTLLV